MHDFAKRLEELYNRWLNGTATDAEAEELGELVERPESTTVLSPLMKLAWQEKKQADILPGDKFRGMATKITTKYSETPEAVTRVVHRVHFLKTAWFRYAAAIIIVLGTGAFLLFNKSENKSATAIAVKQDVPAPSSDQATLTLANGQQIVIGGSLAGEIANEGNVQIQRNANGEIIYEGQTLSGAATQYNILTVPRGGRIATILLSDGTRVFLNSASSLKYPVQFSGDERRVELSGEAYFEVAKNAKAKFTVSDGKMLTEVLGTSFNIHAYPEEEESNITLLDGAVKVSNNHQSTVLKPGEQCLTGDDNVLQVNNDVNVEEVIAWKNGYFQFEQASLSTIAKEVSRWYDVHFVFENKLAEKETFHAKFSRNSTLSELLKILEFTDVKFEIKGNEVTIK